MLIPENDRSYLWGDGLFETIRIVNGRPWRINFHVERFTRSAVRLGFDHAQIERGVSAITSVSGDDGLCRVTIPRESDASLLGGSSTIAIRHRKTVARDSNDYTLSAIANSYFPGDPIAELKSTSYIRSIEVRRQAQSRGADCGVRVSTDGRVGEAAMSNLFAVVDGILVTPTSDGIIAGNVRAFVLESIDVEVRSVMLEELRHATEIFLTSVGVGAQSATVFDGRVLQETTVADQLRALLSW